MDLTTPSLLFSAISLILSAYTDRFLSYASVVRALRGKHRQTRDPKDIAQMTNLRERLYLIRSIQILGIPSLLLCVIAMFFIYVLWQVFAAWIFDIALLLLATSLCARIWKINISVKALEIHLEGIGSKEKLKQRIILNFPSKYFASSERSSILALAIGKSLS